MKKIISFLLITVFLFLFSSCGVKKDDTVMRVGTLAGPTGMGMAKMIEDDKEVNDYNFSVYQDPQKAVTDFLAGDLDAICLPTNTAATLAVKNPGVFKIGAVNCLGSLYLLVKKGIELDSIEDLAGKTIYTSVANSTTNPIVKTILSGNGIEAQIETEADHDALSAKIVKGEVDYAVLPEPKVSAVLMQTSDYEVAFDLSAEWDKVSDGSLTMGCLIIKNDFIKNHGSVTVQFLEKYQNSVEFIKNVNNLDEAANCIVSAGIIPKLPIAKSALTRLSPSLVLLRDKEMKDNLLSFYQVLLEEMPASVGGALPSDSLFYVK